MAAGGDKDLWNDLFGGNDSADAQAQPSTTTAASSEKKKEKKDKKEGKEKKDKKEGKEKKDKKEKDKDGKKEAAPMPSPVEVVAPAPVPEPVKEAEPAKKEKKAGKDKDKKDKKEKKEEKKEKKAKKDKGGGEGSMLDITTPPPETTPVLLPVIEDSQPAPAVEEATEKKGKEKKDKKDKSEKKEKKEKKDKKNEAEDPDGKPDDEKKEKKAKKDKEDKKEKKEKKKEKKEGKEKKRKAEGEISDEDDKRPKLDEEVVEIPDGQEAPLVETADPLYDEFDISKDLVAVEDEDPFGNIDIFDDVFAQAFAGIDEPEPEAVVAAPTPQDDKGVAKRPRVEMPIVAGFFSSKKKDKDAEKQKVAEDAEKQEESLTARWSQVMEHCKVKRALAISEQDSVPYIQDFIQSMVQAAEDDIADFNRGSPMLHKMRQLPKAISIMQKYAFAEIFVIYEGCSALAKWLNVLPNGELPNVHIRTNLLKCMMRLPITKETLANCKGVPLGAVVAKLQNNPNETVSNRKLAAELVQKWLKQVLTKSQMDGFDLDTLQEADLPKAMIPRPPVETADSLRELEAESALRMHPKIPVLEGKEYNIQPMPKDMPLRREKKDLDSNRGKLANVLKVMCRPNKRSWKPYSVSVAGRTINAV